MPRKKHETARFTGGVHEGICRGEPETRRHIWLYSLQLVAVTLLIFAFRMLGWVYLALALMPDGASKGDKPALTVLS